MVVGVGEWVGGVGVVLARVAGARPDPRVVRAVDLVVPGRRLQNAPSGGQPYSPTFFLSSLLLLDELENFVSQFQLGRGQPGRKFWGGVGRSCGSHSCVQQAVGVVTYVVGRAVLPIDVGAVYLGVLVLSKEFRSGHSGGGRGRSGAGGWRGGTLVGWFGCTSHITPDITTGCGCLWRQERICPR